MILCEYEPNNVKCGLSGCLKYLSAKHSDANTKAIVESLNLVWIFFA